MDDYKSFKTLTLLQVFMFFGLCIIAYCDSCDLCIKQLVALEHKIYEEKWLCCMINNFDSYIYYSGQEKAIKDSIEIVSKNH